MSLYERLSSTSSGARALAAARLRYRVLDLLHEGLEASGLTQADVAERLGVRRSAANQVFRGTGNLRVNTVAEYLDAMGRELKLEVVLAGTARGEAQAWRTLATTVAPAQPVSSPRVDLVWQESSVVTEQFERSDSVAQSAYNSKRTDFAMAA